MAYNNFRVSVIHCSYLQCRAFLESISYLQLYILRLCLGWELPQKNLLELRVLCPAMKRCNSCLNKSLSKSWLDKHHCSRQLQVLLVLFLISPLNGHLVVRAAMVLKLEEKLDSVNKEKTKHSFRLSNLIIKSFVYISNHFFHVYTKTFAFKFKDF